MHLSNGLFQCLEISFTVVTGLKNSVKLVLNYKVISEISVHLHMTEQGFFGFRFCIYVLQHVVAWKNIFGCMGTEGKEDN